MRNKLQIYEITHPYIIVTNGGRVYHLNANQHKAILEDIKNNKGSCVITYHDPTNGEHREIPLNLFKIEDLDTASNVRDNLWKSQGGYVCKDGRLVDSQFDCQGNEGFRSKERNIGVNGVFTQAKSDQARTSIIAGLFVGAARHGRLPDYGDKWQSWNIDWDIVKEKIRKYHGNSKIVSEEVRELALKNVDTMIEALMQIKEDQKEVVTS